MRYLAIGGDRRMLGLHRAAQRAGWSGDWFEEELPDSLPACDAVFLPWPHSLRAERLVVDGERMGAPKERLLAALPPCRLVLCGSGVEDEALAQASSICRPEKDELFLRRNAQLTAEGAVCTAMQHLGRSLLGCTCLITGYGRIGQELTGRLVAMGAFVIVCARSEIRMRAAHALGAHPVPLAQLAQAASSADLILSTVPATVLDEAALGRIKKEALIIELASAPYGVDLAAAGRLGLRVRHEPGVPGRYAPMEAGEALFEAALRQMKRLEEGTKHG